MPTKYFKQETFDEKEIQEVVEKIETILLQTELDDESIEDTSRADVIFELIGCYSWEVLQQAMFKILLDNRKTEDDYYQISLVFWFAILENQTRKNTFQTKLKFKKKTIIGLLYYRLKDWEYAENTIWSITCDLYHLDYCNSTYDPMKDEKIIEKLKQYGIDKTRKDSNPKCRSRKTF